MSTLQKTLVILLGLSLIACHSGLKNTVSHPNILSPIAIAHNHLAIRQISKEAPQGKIQIEQGDSPNQVRMTFTIALPPPIQGESPDFQTQALPLNQAGFLKVSVRGPGLNPIYADGSDGQNMLANTGGDITAVFSSIPAGSLRLASIEAYDANRILIPGATIKSIFQAYNNVSGLEISFRTTPNALMFEGLFNQPQTLYSMQGYNPSSLQANIFDPMMGVTGTWPNYTYTKHPTLVKADVVRADLLDDGFVNFSADKFNAASTVTLNITGLLGADRATLQVTDPASAIFLNVPNGPLSITGVTPGNWKVLGSASGYTVSGTPTVNPNPGTSISAGTLNFSKPTPIFSSLSPTSGIIGSTVTITGSNFSSTPANNTVKFGITTATVLTATTTQLTAQVPPGISGAQNVNITVNGVTSTSRSFAVRSNITSLAPSSGAVGSSLQINGTGFADTGNTVKLGTTTALVTSASNTQLTVTVPQAGNGNFTVQVGTQTSNALAFNVLPTIQLTQPANNALLNGSVNFNTTTTAGNPITKVEFFDGASLLGQDTTSPYTFNWNTLLASSGARSLKARITDNQGNAIESSGVNVTVDQRPVISSLTSTPNPLIGLSHPIKLHCAATDAEGTPTLTWSTVGGSFGSFSSTTGADTYWTAPATSGGPYTIRCSASDGVNTPTTQDLNLTVLDGNSNITGNGGLF